MTRMGDENRWQIEYLQRFGVYTFFRELVKGSELTLGNDGVLALLCVSAVWNFSVSIECDVNFLCENRVWVGQVKVLWNACGVWKNRIGVSKCERSEWHVRRGKGLWKGRKSVEGVQGRKPVPISSWRLFSSGVSVLIARASSMCNRRSSWFCDKIVKESFGSFFFLSLVL